MEAQLYEGLAIPIKQKEEYQLGRACPNFLVITYQSGFFKFNTINILTGDKEIQDCIEVSYKLVNRGFLEETENRSRVFQEIELFSEKIPIPVNILPLLASQLRVKENVETLNLALSFFNYRGVLKFLKLEIDETVLDEILIQEVNQ